MAAQTSKRELGQNPEVGPHVRIIDVSKIFTTGRERLKVLEDLNLQVAYGEFLSVLGPSGCGKTTLLRIIGGLSEPTCGQVFIGRQTSMDAQGDKIVGYVFQEPSLLPWRTVIDNIRLPLEVNRRQRSGDNHNTEDLVRLVGLERFRSYYPFQLSGGMQQRVALARALVFEPSLLLMDEPFGALDEITRAAMRYELLRIWDTDKKTVVFVTHSIAEAITLSDRVVVLSGQPGKIMGVVDIDMPRPRSDNLERGEEYLRYSKLLHSLLLKHGSHENALDR